MNIPIEPLFLIIYAIIIFVISAFITREIFSISTSIRMQKAQVSLLAKIARQQGVSDDEVNRSVGNLLNDETQK